MSDTRADCHRVRDSVVAAATGEASPDEAARAQEHLATCAACRRDFEGVRAADQAVAALRDEPAREPVRARQELDRRLAELRQRLLLYGIFPSPLGRLLIARSERGVALIEYLDQGMTVTHSRLSRERDIESAPGGADLEATYRDVLDYLQGRSKRLNWPLDLRLARGEFQRSVLKATAAIPYGAVMAYAGVARELGRAAAVRAVAQALRWNPLPIVIPCHRVIGSSGALTGYAGNKLDRKRTLLSVEGIPLAAEQRISPEAMYFRYPGDSEYCLPTCPSLARRPPAPVMRFASREVAEAAGFAPCTACRPDLHPISR